MLNKFTNIVIGGSGFVGSKLCQALNKEGGSVLSIANSTNPEQKNINQEICDVNEIIKLTKLLKGGENIFILIGQTHPKFSKKNELNNIKNIIRSIDIKITKKIFYFSSIHVYGETNQKVKENSLCCPVDEYGKFKLESEKLFLKINIPVIIIRPTNIYGNPGNKGFIGIVFDGLFNNEILNINNGGKQKKDFIIIDDLINALLAIKKLADKNDIINISTGKSDSIIDIVKIIEKVADRKIDYQLDKTIQKIEVKNNYIDNSKLRQKYRYIPKFDLEKGLKLTYKRYLEYYKKK
ncbi:hypothetical protein COZ61_00205 [Candidatus Berkelbacteria bacterium CG_4_8_14_3_um_filter_33_6]|nr:MAG: hypothetical protein COT76_02915 [Candidatus Berkelbacteria bacterium CG10_big_fil_rev_8_21_14_0_10_33_10]PIX31348.1 MAG: hypothetical protein COZ61_00205 [Candidatus Berkelbacteria bacterium CG_4_8_14_3_um_filter_33_6]